MMVNRDTDVSGAISKLVGRQHQRIAQHHDKMHTLSSSVEEGPQEVTPVETTTTPRSHLATVSSRAHSEGFKPPPPQYDFRPTINKKSQKLSRAGSIESRLLQQGADREANLRRKREEAEKERLRDEVTEARGAHRGQAPATPATSLDQQHDCAYRMIEWKNNLVARAKQARERQEEEELAELEQEREGRFTQRRVKVNEETGSRLHKMAARQEQQRVKAVQAKAAEKAKMAKPKITKQGAALERRGDVAQRLYEDGQRGLKRRDVSATKAFERPPTNEVSHPDRTMQLFMDGDRIELKRKLAVYFEEASKVALSDITQHLDAKSLSIAETLPHTSADRLHGELVARRDIANLTSHLDENTFTPHFYTNEHKTVAAANNAHQPVTQVSQARRHDRLYNQAVEQRQRQAVLELTRMIDEFGPLGGNNEAAQRSPRVRARPSNPEVPYVEDRLNQWLAARNQKRDVKKQELSDQVFAECTFHPESATRHYRPDTATTVSSPRTVRRDGSADGVICDALPEPPPCHDSGPRKPVSPLEQTSPVKTGVEIKRSDEIGKGDGAEVPPDYSDVAVGRGGQAGAEGSEAPATPRSRTRGARRSGATQASPVRVVRIDDAAKDDDAFISSLIVSPRTGAPAVAVDLL